MTMASPPPTASQGHGAATPPTAAKAIPLSVIHGAVLMTFSGALFPVSDAVVKHLSQGFDAPQLVWGRNFFFFLTTCAIVAWYRRKRPVPLRSARLWLHLSRGLLMASSGVLFLTAVTLMPIADAVAILFVGPLIVVLISGPALGERIGLRQWLAVLCGFAGALLIIRPDASGFNVASLLVLMSAFVWACQQIIARKLAATELSLTSLFYVALVGAAVLSPFMPAYWKHPGGLEWSLMFLSGFVTALGQWGVIKAIEAAPVSTLAPFNYSQIVSAVLVGYLVFGHLPDLASAIGLILVAVSGVAVGLGERRIAAR